METTATAKKEYQITLNSEELDFIWTFLWDTNDLAEHNNFGFKLETDINLRDLPDKIFMQFRDEDGNLK